jgi:hypothetical protein
MKKKEIHIIDGNGNKLNTAALLKMLGYDVYALIKPPAYAAALVLEKVGFNQQEIIKLITDNYSR